MCRPNALGGRRCPSHTDPTFVANRNARRRAQYAKQKHTNLADENTGTLLTTHAKDTAPVHFLFRAPFDDVKKKDLYFPADDVGKKEELNVSIQKHAGYLVNAHYLAGTEISGVINYTNLDDESYKKFGFNEPGTGKQMQPEVASDLSVREMKGLSVKERKSLQFFTTDEFEWMNGALYRNDTILDKETTKQSVEQTMVNVTVDERGTRLREHTSGLLKSVAEGMDSALKKSPHVPRIVYRGMSASSRAYGGDMTAEEWAAKNFSLGQEVIFDGYQSTTLNPNTANNFVGHKGILYEIHTPEGVNITSISEWDEEEEVLLPRKSRYMCVGFHENVPLDVSSRTTNTVTVVQLVAINDKGEALNSKTHHQVDALTDEDLQLRPYNEEEFAHFNDDEWN